MSDVRQRHRRSPRQPDPQPDPEEYRAASRHSASKRRSGVPHTRALLLGVAAFYALGLTVVTHLYTWLPPPRALDAPTTLFSEARARVVLEQIMSFGYHPVGTRANEELIPEYLISEIEKIRAAAGPDVIIELDVQRPSGAFGLNFMAQFQNIYANVTNILVRVSPADNPAVREHALMLSSHYDAAIGGAAASDDGVNIAIMMELLRVFAAAPPKFGALVFNFNGAEETIMQAAHGFITQHPWTDSIRAFINLEAAGAGGRELLFQTGSDELALAYAQGAKYPHASIIAQEIFQSGFIKADTDYRIYRDFGAVAGMDFAYIENGYVYHTALDDISRIQQGAVQRLGDNVAGVVDQLANQAGRLEKVAATPESSNTLFFDVFGVGMVTMGKTTEFTICSAVLAVALLYIAVSPIRLRERLSGLQLIARCAGMGLAANLATALLMSLFAPLSWYSQLKLGAAMFVAPMLTGMLDQLIRFLEKKESVGALWQLEESLFEGALLLWAAGLGLLMAIGAISSYLPAVWIVFPLIGQILCHTLQRLKLLSTGVYVALSIGAIAVPVLHTSAIAAVLFVFFMPLMGRSGTQLPPDLLVAVLFAMLVLVLVSFSGRFFCFFPVRQLKTLRNVFGLVWLVTVVIGSLVNPYTDDCPKRLMVQHVHREEVLPNGEVKTDSGLWINALDFRGVLPVKPYLATTQWRHLSSVSAPEALHESAEIYGHMPWALPVKDLLPERGSWYLPSAAPVIPAGIQRPKLEVVSSKYSSETDRRVVHLHLTGPTHLNVFIDARNTTLTSWSIGNGINGPAPESNDSYILQFCSGTTPASLHFWVEAVSAKPINAVVVGHFLELATPEMREFEAALPSWYATMSAVSTWSRARVRKLLSSRAELEATQVLLGTLVAGEPLAAVAAGGSLAELRRTLRSSLEAQQLALADAVLGGLTRTLEGAAQLRTSVEALGTRCSRIQSFLEATKRETQQVQADAARLADRKEKTQRELDEVRAFLARYQLSEQETQVLCSPSLGDEQMPVFLDTMERVQQVKLDCKALVAAGDVGCALELLDAVGKYQEVGFERLYQWTSKKCAEMDDEPSALLHRAIALLRDRPEFYNYCKECITASRRSVLVRRFVVALTRGGPNGIPRPIELHAHDPVRYCGDMLAWVHQAIATENEFFRVLFDGDLEFLVHTNGGDDERHGAVTAGDREDGEAAQTVTKRVSMVGKAFEGVARPLQVRIEQTLTSQLGIVVAYKLVLLLGFYDHKFAALVPSCGVARALEHCRAASSRAFHQQFQLLVDAVASSAQDYSTNLSATHATMEASQRLVSLLEVFQTSLLPEDEKEADLAPLFDGILPAIAQMCERSVHGLDAVDALVFKVNNLSCVQVPLARFPEARKWYERIGAELAQWLNAISELETKSVLDRSGMAQLLHSIQQFQTSESASSSSLAVQAKGLEPETVITVMNGFCSALMAIAFPQVDQLAQPDLREKARLLTATQLAATYAFAYDFVYDAKHGFRSQGIVLMHTPQEVRTVLEIE